MSWSAALVASLLVTLGRPTWWILALAGFLVRGGAVLFVLPIVVLPTPLAIATEIAPLVRQIGFGTSPQEVTTLAVSAGLVLVGWLFLGGWLAALGEVVLIREAAEAAADEGLADGPAAIGPGRRLAAGVLVVRLLALAPLAIAIGLGIVQVVNVAYVELTRPLDVATPLVIRVVLGAAGPIVAIVLVWFLGELAGGLAARRIVLDGMGPSAALGAAVQDIVRRPRSTLPPALVATAIVLVVLAAILLAAGIAWTRLRSVLAEFPTGAFELAVALATFVGIWLVALALGGVLTGWRSTAMTFAMARPRSVRALERLVGERGAAGEAGTFGAP